MTSPALKKSIVLIVFLVGICCGSRAQLCTGSLGDPVINISFGSGGNPGAPLVAASTTYKYSNTSCPEDGYYTVASSTSACFGNTWLTLRDHTGNPNGYFMLINASFEPGDFYIDNVTGLCASTTYQFSAWIINMLRPGSCNDTGILPNISFNIETNSGTVLQHYNTGNLATTGDPNWKQYGFFFTTPADVTSVVLRMTNNAPGGCGNDLALDDIQFRPCGPLVTASVEGNTGTLINLCAGDPATLAFHSTVSSGYIDPAYQWQLSIDSGKSWANINGATATSYARQPTTTGTYLYRMNVGEAGNILLPTCRISSNSLTVTVNPNPVAATTTHGINCSGTSLYLEASGGATYSWSGPAGFSSSKASDSIEHISVSASGIYRVTVTSATGCSSKDSVTVLVHPDPVSKFQTSIPACENKSIAFTDQSDPAGQTLVKWHWNFGDGDSTSLQNPTHTFASAQSFPVKLFVQTNNGCQDSLEIPTNVHPLPHVNFGTPEVCLTDPFAAFSDSTTISDGSEAGFRWQWNFGDPNASPANPDVSSIKNPQHSYTAVGIYPVSLSVTSANGCPADTVISFTVNGAFPVAGFEVVNAGHLCGNQPVTIINHSTVNFGNITKLEVYWDYGNDPLSKTTDEVPAPGKAYQFSYPDFGEPLSKSYQIRFVAYSGIGCVNETVQTITLQASPQLQFGALPSVCENAGLIAVTQARETSGLEGNGSYSGNGADAAGIFNPRTAGAGADSVFYTYTAANGCSAEIGQTILVYPNPKADAGPARTVLEGSSIVLDGSGTGNDISYLWLPDSAMDNNHIATPRISPTSDMLYTLIVTSAAGCSDSSQVEVKVLKKPIVPNAFSPNGDGINDTWVIKYLDSYPGAEVSVFNRYGQLVYHSTGFYQPWDGRYDGKPLPVATYYWIINPKNGRAQMNGSVTILR